MNCRARSLGKWNYFPSNCQSLIIEHHICVKGKIWNRKVFYARANQCQDLGINFKTILLRSPCWLQIIFDISNVFSVHSFLDEATGSNVSIGGLKFRGPSYPSSSRELDHHMPSLLTQRRRIYCKYRFLVALLWYICK